MEKKTYGKPHSPAVLLLAEDGAENDLYSALSALEKSYYLLCPHFSSDEDADTRLRLLESWLQEEHIGRIWAAYGLRRGGELLLTLLARGSIRIRTAVTESVYALPASSLGEYRGRLFYWYHARDCKAKKTLKTLRKALPSLHTVALKKLKAAQDFVSVRPDLMIKRLENTFGKAQTVTVSTVLPTSRSALWRQLYDRPETGVVSRSLRDGLPLERSDGAYTQVVEGRTGHTSHWSHLTRLESLDGGNTKYTDQVEVSAGKLTPVAALFTRAYLRRQQKKRAAALK